MIPKRKAKQTLPQRRLERPASEPAGAAFRRGQTLNSYRTDPVDEDSARKRTHELNKLRRRIVAALMVVLVFSGLILLTLWQFTGSVAVEASINGRSVDLGAREQVYVQAIGDYYAKNPVERLRFAQDTKRLLDFLQGVAPEVQDIKSLEPFGLPSRLTFNLELRRPVAEWIQGGKAFYVDGSGHPFEYNYYERPALSIYDENNLGSQLGQPTLASNRFLQTVGRLVSDIDARKLVVEKLVIPRGMVREIDVVVQGSGIRFKLNVDRSPAEQAEDIQRVLSHFARTGENPEYVDLRIEQKAYYK
ncbi:MAG: hypothetical protein LBG75_03620 [Candidatus Nomurabacteria bacterium]|jgi:cell division septal protein FtsQ|nr:hypothetical protein [Candidatus Nomurabacteria bacterium]